MASDLSKDAEVAASDLPKDQEAERQILGALMLRSDLVVHVTSVLNRDDFFSDKNRLIFDTILSLYADSSPSVDALTVIHHLEDRSILDRAGGASYILQIYQDVISAGVAPSLAKRVKSYAIRRRLIQAATKIKAEAALPQEDENSFLKSVEERVLSITNLSFSHGVMQVSELKEEFKEYIGKLIQAGGRITGLRTHFHEFDRLTSGLRGGELIVLAARPGQGKTTLAMNIVANVCMHEQKHVLVYSLEMSRLELLLRFLCSESQTNHSDLKRGNIPPQKRTPVIQAMERIFAAPLHIDDTGALDMWDCITRTRKLAVDLDHKRESLGLIVVDYLQLLSDAQSRKHGRQHEVAAVSRALKQLAKAVNAPVLALSQMNRSVEQRRGESSRPQLSDLRESGAIEQDADMVLFIHQDKGLDEDAPTELKDSAEIIIAKHRNGPLGNFRLAFRREINRFDNLSADFNPTDFNPTGYIPNEYTPTDNE